MTVITNTTLISNFASIGQLELLPQLWGRLYLAARKASESLNVPVSGTVGVLLSLVKHNQLASNEADAILQQMVQLGYRSPIASLNEVLGQR